MSNPEEHVADAHKLTADAKVKLFHFILTNGSHLYLKANNDATWQGHTWEGVGIKLGENSNSSGDDVSRPQLVIANPAGAFSYFIVSKAIDRATVLVLEVLKQHLENDQAVYKQKTWMVSRTVLVNRSSVTLELRNQLDGPNLIVPARSYMPPEFPTVSI